MKTKDRRILSRRWILSVIILIALLLAGCRNPEDLGAVEKNKKWGLLWISDSSGWHVADIYGELIAEDKGVEVIVNDMWKGGLEAGKVLKALQGEEIGEYDLDKLREYVTESEVIVVYGNPELSVSEDNPWDFNCGQGSGECYVNACEMDNFELYIDHLEEIYSIIFELRKGKPTIIRAIDAYNPVLVQQCTPYGTFDVCLECWENYNKAIHQAADAMDVPVAGVFNAWNGPDHTEDPNDKGYTQSDKIHPNKKGAAVIAESLRDIGYETITP